MSDESDLIRYKVEAEDYARREVLRREELGLPPESAPAVPAPQIPRGFPLPVQCHLAYPIPVWPGHLENCSDTVIVGVKDLPELTDRLGRVSLLEYLADPSLQIERWGREVVRIGPWPTDEPAYLPGSATWDLVRSKAFSDARLITHAADRQAAIAACRERFGAEHGRPSPAQVAKAYGMAEVESANR